MSTTTPLNVEKEEPKYIAMRNKLIEISRQLTIAKKLLLQHCPERLDSEGNVLKNYKSKKEKKPKKNQISSNRRVFVKKSSIFEFSKNVGGCNVITRQLTKTASELDKFDKTTSLSTKRYKFKNNEVAHCYGCNKLCASMHPVYVYSCRNCGELFQQNRNLTRDLSNTVSLVIGCRTKLGHQVTLKLLRAGSTVIGTTRYPEDTKILFSQYEDYEIFKDRLIIYNKGLDLDTNHLENNFRDLKEFIEQKYGHLNHFIFCAAQTIRVREKERNRVKEEMKETNRYGDAKFVKETNINSWKMTIEDLNQKEMEEVIRINSIAPTLLTKMLIPLLKKSTIIPYIIFVHAREGVFQCHKTKYHIHTNMAKASLAMLTLCLCSSNIITENGLPFSVHGCDPGWISVDEYYENDKPFEVAPLDEVDGASRVLYPLFKELRSESKTRRHYTNLTF
ncbi:hypothetical protein EDI_284920 [Entamoeba dispar SAW760]|uniref:Short-chain dehydrogenase n=1 Tax=Entamoeba dispar (strain ATCC PRA-260 / SAW760) TaxID=370354 RepID=B0EV67_ENTDS|nr:uncharacterized protein EDI_284920 [Entamoeba dispar SAW760]EDR21574.1 hypothetical protein EDI_284920 [Entamoeba dispar SAW760]|eukprot:EDR21574.1 hypothetical protein EDI_284920 [Entamoeba dispar SAW760]